MNYHLCKYRGERSQGRCRKAPARPRPCLLVAFLPVALALALALARRRAMNQPPLQSGIA